MAVQSAGLLACAVGKSSGERCLPHFCVGGGLPAAQWPDLADAIDCTLGNAACSISNTIDMLASRHISPSWSCMWVHGKHSMLTAVLSANDPVHCEELHEIADQVSYPKACCYGCYKQYVTKQVQQAPTFHISGLCNVAWRIR